MRDFYGAGKSTSAARQSSPQTAPAFRSQVAAVAYAPQTASTRTAPLQKTPPASPLSGYLQRLSVDGEHAFGVWSADAGFSLFSANFERVTGLNASECAGHDWIHAVHHQQQYNLNEALLGALQGHDGRCLVQTRCDEHEPWRWLMVDIKAPAHAGADVMVLWRDLSEQKALEEALKATESALALSDRGRNAFLSSMSHELRTPLNAIMGFAEMMKEGVLGPLPHDTYREYVTHIHDSGANLLGKISALLDIASMDAGRLELDEEEFALDGLLAELSEIHSHHAFARGQQLSIDCPGNYHVFADRAKLLCACSHLVSNALRHSADGASVQLSVRVQPGDSLVLSVRDHGEGISPAQLTSIRAALGSDTAYLNVETGGIGLGLSLALELMGRHGGRITLDSIRKRGTVAALTLPLSRVTQGLPRKRTDERRLQLVE
ncbi:MAG: ATP-binding protein [Rickettsiales bacterium]